eukprot:14762651-Alexandrium_andersonii.AAC.1
MSASLVGSEMCIRDRSVSMLFMMLAWVATAVWYLCLRVLAFFRMLAAFLGSVVSGSASSRARLGFLVVALPWGLGGVVSDGSDEGLAWAVVDEEPEEPASPVDSPRLLW